MTARARIGYASVCLLLASTAAGGDGAIRSLHVDGGTIWAAGDASTVLVSRDSGNSFSRVEVPIKADFEAVSVEGDTVRLLGGQAVYGHPDARERAVILRSDDGGKTFEQAPAPPGGRLYGGAFDARAAVVFGEATPNAPSGVWRTVTAGARWTPVESEQDGYLLGGDFSGVRLGYAVGGNRRIMSIRRLKEPDIRPPPLNSRHALRAAALSDEQTCWAVGDAGTVLKSRPGGQPWDKQALPAPPETETLADFSAVCSPSPETVYVGGGVMGSIFRTTDGGENWRRLDAPGPGAVHTLTAVDDDVVFAGGDSGRIWRSNDGGLNWKRLHGPESTDVLFIISPAETTVYPAIVAHALSGADVAVVFATCPEGPAGAAPDQALRAAAAEAGAGGITVFGSFPSLAASDYHTLTADHALEEWTDALNAPARDEMLRHMAAVIRLYRPAVVALGPDTSHKSGAAAERGFVSELAREAVDLAADEGAFDELEQVNLPPWKVQRVFTGMEGNDRWTGPWRRRESDGRDGNFSIDATAFAAAADNHPIEMLSQRAIWRLPGTGPTDRPATITNYRCEDEHRRLPLFTTGLTSHSLRADRVDDHLSQLASAAQVRFASARGNLVTALGPLMRIAEHQDADDAARVLAADRILLTWCGLLEQGRFQEAGQAERKFLRIGRSHPLYEQVRVTALVRATSREWLAQLTAEGPQQPFAHEEREQAIGSFAEMPAWSLSAPGRMLHGRALATAGRQADAADVYQRLADGPYPPYWRNRGLLELVDTIERLPDEDRPRVVQAMPINIRGQIDGRMDEDFWSDATTTALLKPDGSTPRYLPSATMKAVRAQALVVLGFRLPAYDDEHWRLDVAVDGDRDGWTQLVVTCDTRGDSSVRLVTRCGPDASPAPDTAMVAVAEDNDGYSAEIAIPVAAVGSDSGPDAWGFQVRATFDDGGRRQCLYAQPQDDPRLLPERYGLLVLPRAAGPPSNGDEDPPPQTPARR